MKKIITTLCILLAAVCNAQLANGTIAPDFTVTDINGTTHSLSTYLNAGKSVILEFSSVNCGPCWKYLKTEAMSDFYNAYGEPGSNEVVVLFIEDATYSTLQELQGVSNPPTFGNWVANVPFPIILDAPINDLYNITYNPTIYKICPDGIIDNLFQETAYILKMLVNSDCGTLTGLPNFGKVIETQNGFCSTDGNFVTKIKNYGSNTLTTAKLNLKENGVVVATKSITGNVSQFESMPVEFETVTINPSATYTAEIEEINGVANYNPEFSVANLPFYFSKPTEINIDIKVHTYSCPKYMTWSITNSEGTIVAHGGPYDGYQGSSCGGPNSNSIMQHTATLPAADDCYTLTLQDSSGYGWKNYSAYSEDDSTPGIEIFSNNNLVYSYLNVGNFGSKLVVENFLTTGETLGIAENKTDSASITPNPSTGIFHFDIEDVANITIFDITGKKIYSSESTGNNPVVDLSHLSNGVYVARINKTTGESISEKLILKQ